MGIPPVSLPRRMSAVFPCLACSTAMQLPFCIKKSSSTNNGIEIPKLNAVASDKSFLAYRELVEIGFEKLAL